MSDAFYKNSIQNFLNQSEDEIFGIIASADRYDTVAGFVDAVLDGDIATAAEKYKRLSDIYYNA